MHNAFAGATGLVWDSPRPQLIVKVQVINLKVFIW